jgi:hypothetical protein
MLSSVFTAAFGASGGPEVGIFKRFQKQWSTIDQDVFIPGSDTLFSTPELLSLRAQLVVYYTEALNTKQTRDDYAELLNLCRIFLGETANVHFRAPGATHNARWMSKAIYCLKIYLFQHQFVLTQSEKKGVTAVSLFVSIIYGQFWNEAPVAEKAPLNDVKLLTRLESYPDEIIRDAASKAFKRHLWYLSEHLIGLSFFDPQIEADVKKAMANNLNRPAMASNLKRLDGAKFDPNTTLDEYVTERTAELFDLLLTNGRTKSASFVSKDPSEWKTDPVFLDMEERVRQMKVINDCAERGIALITTYNSSITKDEEQKQFLLRLVDLHRKEFPQASKAVFMKQ